ncbi:hypothetical protein B0J11DRAFT_293132 [Dendryphion nanum]|uniref:DUF8004 domain-containing protein n=1 Tax=Dendryphion nanum TaxID=256645 RepID=A0A9P9ILR6_9PLEO|nr:hypothetical protein B0J11DRAFT_293132 [Dendryphion nanum]
MSARGARSRKAVAKDIEKKEKKTVDKQKGIETVKRPHDAFAEWTTTPTSSRRDPSLPSRSLTISSDVSRGTSRSSSTNPSSNKPRLNTIISHESSEPKSLHRPQTLASDSASVISGGSSKGKEKSKYQAKGKETKAPRGRGGGVPLKKPAGSANPLPPSFRSETSASAYAPPTQKTWMNFRIWKEGDGTAVPYGGFDYDEDMQDGNVLIYFTEEQVSEDRPVPQIRAHLDVLENSGSTWLSNALLYGRIDDGEDEWALDGSPEASTSSYGFSPHGFPEPPGQRRMLGPTSLGGISPPPFSIDQTYYGVPGSGSMSRAQFYPDMDLPAGSRSPPPFQQKRQQQPTHELYFTAPKHVKTPQAQRLHHVAVRNFLAMLHNKPIVGADLYEMLSTLQPEIQVMYDLDHDVHSRMTARERSVQMIIDYLIKHKLDDVRSSINTALSILAWSEQDNVKWKEGYMESFVHLAGILSPQIEELPDFKRLSIVTRRNLGIAAKTLELRVIEAEEKLSTFDFSEMWGESPKLQTSPIYQSCMGFRNFLVKYYSRHYGSWPPKQSKTWLNRKIVLALQDDFGILYDYLVNRDVNWDSQEERPGKKWQMVDKRFDEFSADGPSLPMTDMLVTFDNKYGYLHIPYPFPLLPREVPTIKTVQKKSFFGGLKKSKVDTAKDAKAHLQLSIVFSDATNLEKTDVSFNTSTLIDQFERFELSADLQTTTPREARLGHWILLYGILQVLSTLSVDVPGLKWTNGVRYFLCSDLKRCPEWVTEGGVEQLEASQIRSYCWQRPWGPTSIPGAPIELEASSLPISGELDSTVTSTSTLDNSLDGATMLDQDIRRISEKINDMTTNGSRARRDYERRIENEKTKQEEFGVTKRIDESYRLTESDYAQRPLPPLRTQGRSPTSPYMQQSYSPSQQQQDYTHQVYPQQQQQQQQQSYPQPLYTQQFSGQRNYSHQYQHQPQGGNGWN